MTRLAQLSGRDAGVAAVIGDELLDLQRASAGQRVPASVADALADAPALAAIDRIVKHAEDADDAVRARLRETGALVPLRDAALRAPLTPRLIICCGHTYASHAKEMGSKAPQHPAGFIKNSHIVIGPGAAIVLPSLHGEQVDFEGEFAFVIGRRCHNVSVDDAMSCIAGYTLINDVSARDWVAEAKRTGDMFFNTLGKQFPTFCPMGPCVTTADEIRDPHAVKLTTTVNGHVMQQASTAELAFTIPQILAFWSRWYEFLPGDVITTGSPAGVGFSRTPPQFLKNGDVVVVSGERIGSLTNPVQASSAHS